MTEPRLDFRPAILRALAQLGGAAPAAIVAERARLLLAEQLTLQDYLKLGQSNELRWQRDLRIAVDRLAAEGLLTITLGGHEWQLTEQGREIAKPS